MKIYVNILFKIIFLSCFSVNIVYADPFNRSTDSGIRCSIPANNIYRFIHFLGEPVLTDAMFENSVGFNYDDETGLFTTNFGPVSETPINLEYSRSNPDVFISLLSKTSTLILEDLNITDELAYTLNQMRKKEQMGFNFRYDATTDKWTVFGLFDPLSNITPVHGKLPRGLFLKLTRANCTAIKKALPTPHASSSSQDKSVDSKEK